MTWVCFQESGSRRPKTLVSRVPVQGLGTFCLQHTGDEPAGPTSTDAIGNGDLLGETRNQTLIEGTLPIADLVSTEHPAESCGDR